VKRAAARPEVLLLVLSVAVFVLTAADVTWDGLVARADPHVARWAFLHLASAHAWLGDLTHLGDASLLAVVVALVALTLLAAGRRADAVLLVAAAALTAGVTSALKEAFARSRPPYVDPAFELHSFSFPSGHTSGAFAVYVLTAFLLADRLGPGARAAAVAGAVALATAVAVTRVLLPVHYTTDVIAGAAIGLGVVALALVARAMIREPS
jgi:undecaprenyl-diphosphatase